MVTGGHGTNMQAALSNPKRVSVGILRGAFGWTLFGANWGLAAAGVVLKAFYKTAHPTFNLPVSDHGMAYSDCVQTVV